MTQVWKTLDGAIFYDELDAAKHEQAILQQVEMYGWEKRKTADTANARLVHLSGEGAGAIFKTMARENVAEFATQEEIEDWMGDEDTGWFYWDEFSDCYRYLDQRIVDPIIFANQKS